MEIGVTLIPDVLLSYVAEKNNQSPTPMYIKTPQSLLGVLTTESLLLYPYQWTQEQASEWFKNDANEWKNNEQKS